MADQFTDAELDKFLEGEVDADFTPDITEQEALDEVNRARRHTEFLKKREEAFKLMQKYHSDPAKLWQVAYKWLMISNPDARADIEAVIKECEEIRSTRANKFARSKDIGLRYGMRIPRIVLETLQYIDPRIEQIELQDPASGKKLYREIEAAFPQFRIPKSD